MSHIRLVLADKDSMFLEKFSAYLQKNKATRFSLELFTSSIKLDSWLEKGGKADLIAISSTLFSKMVKKPESKNVVILSDNSESLLPQDYNCIHKYKPAENLMKEMLSLCAENLPQSINKKEDSGRVHLVLYADGSDVLNPMAQTLASIFSKSLRSTIYLSLDDLSNTDAYFSGNNSKGLSEMLYYVKSQKENLSLRAEACTSRDFEIGVDFMRGHQNPEDLGELKSSECESLIEAIRGRACYDDIIISRAFQYDALLPVLFKNAHKIYITALDYRSSIERLLKILNLLSKFEDQSGIDLKDKVLVCITLLNKNLQASSQELFCGPNKTQQPQVIDISHYQKTFLPFPFEEGVSFFPPSGEYQSALKKIVDQ